MEPNVIKFCVGMFALVALLSGLASMSAAPEELMPDRDPSCSLMSILGQCEHDEASMLDNDRCRFACCRHWAEASDHCATNVSFMDGFCRGSCDRERSRLEDRKEGLDDDYEAQWKYGMELLDKQDREGYYWLCRSGRRAVAGRESLAFILGEDTEVSLWPLCGATPKKSISDEDAYQAWLAPVKLLPEYDEDELVAVRVLADAIFDARDDDHKKHGKPVVAEKRKWRISDAPEDNPDQTERPVTPDL